jgi:DNA-binding FadR family transcriptional regulator
MDGEAKSVFKVVTRRSVSEDVVQQIKKSIIEGIFKPGEKLPPERYLRKMFNVSRGSLREALKSLERMGFVVIKTGVSGGTYVTDKAARSISVNLYDIIRMNRIGLRELLETRKIIEPGIAALAAEKRTKEDVKRLEGLNALREKAIKADKIPIVVSIDWHQAVAMASGNQLLCLVIDAIAMALNDEFKKISLSMEDHRVILDYHKKITSFIKNGDSKAASELMREHVEDVIKRLT